jgi:peptide chain release factor
VISNKSNQYPTSKTTTPICQSEEIVWLQLTAGQGPKECGWVVAQLCYKIMQQAVKAKLIADKVEALAFDKALRNQDLVEPEAYLSVMVRLAGEGAKNFAAAWQGTIKWQGTSPYRPHHKRYNWFVAVIIINPPGKQTQSLGLQSLNKEVEFTSMRSTGPGGQHLNKTNSAVRLTHRPTGLQIRVDTDRSQHRNRQLALERLQLLLAAGSAKETQAQERLRWLNHYQVARGNPLRIFYGIDFIEK